jgi:acyl-coenzyme A synthetase/AMP-(fatty) acid ligase
VREGGRVSGEEVLNWAREKSGLGRFMMPREVRVVGELPKTSTGKVKKNVLREWANEGKDGGGE